MMVLSAPAAWMAVTGTRGWAASVFRERPASPP